MSFKTKTSLSALIFLSLIFCACGAIISPKKAIAQTNEEIISILKNAEQVKEKFVRSPNTLINKLPRSGETYSGPLKPHKDEVKSILAGAVSFSGCRNSNHYILGYFNVSHNVWFFLWLDKNGKLISARTTIGPALKGTPDKNRWVDLWNQREIAPSMREAFKIQSKAFATLFSQSICPTPEQIDFLIQDNAAITGMIYNSQKRSEIPKEFQSQIISTTHNALKGVVKKKDLVITYTHPNALGMDLLSITTSKKRPDTLIIDGWEEKDGILHQIYNETFNLVN
ncbi:hypothetical protein GG681_10960 [Epibacterium sp. SM1969]|uniref:Uncharacterized protein n=1 Tax=Tritonibacter aquimaris TaxID=2663379 RepID=A0A844ALU0_9RHOB|nr:hypothetical protein [Tritonibacter aquimaris]MQY43160.1 hypothetical protein [Tritonibacter aquimaris]